MAHIQKLYETDEKKKVRAYKAIVEVGVGENRKRRTKTFSKEDGYINVVLLLIVFLLLPLSYVYSVT